MKKRILSVLFAAVITVCLLAVSACGDSALALVFGGKTEYVIVCSDDATDEERRAAELLQSYMQKCGVDIALVSDAAEPAECEIVVGATLRDAADGYDFDRHEVGHEGHAVFVCGSRVYLTGGTESGTLAAAEAFLTEFFGYTEDAETANAVTKVSVPSDYRLIAPQEYAVSQILVDGADLRGGKILLGEQNEEYAAAAEKLREFLYTTCGIWLEINADGETFDGVSLILSPESPKTEGFFEATVQDGSLVLLAGGINGMTKGIEQFLADVIAPASGVLNFDAGTVFSADVSYVRYSDFGAVGDGKTDDMSALIATHEYANEHGLSVRGDVGAVYYIGVADVGAVIKTDTDWTGASFIIDDSNVGDEKRTVDIFRVSPSKSSYNVSGVTSLKMNQENIGVTLPYDSLIRLENNNVKLYIREGVNQDNGAAQSEIIFADKNGNVDPMTSILWDYDEITSIIAFPVDEETLTITGGTFTTIANRSLSSNYYKRGIMIHRSNVILDGLTHYIEGEGDHGAPYNGFLQVINCMDVTVQNCVFTAHRVYKNPNSGASMGTYDLTPSYAVNLLFKNCTQTTDILDTAYWGLMGSNFSKNITLDGCTFSRFDAHRGVFNATIKNSTLGHQGINAIGKGTFLVENSTLYGKVFINLRSDYGSTWEGDIIIRDCSWYPKGGKADGTCYLIGGAYTGWHDFGYPCYMPHTITIDGLTIEDKRSVMAYNGIYLFADFTPECVDESYEKKIQNEGYPYNITEQVTISGFKSQRGKPYLLSPNEFMFRNVVVTDLDKETPAAGDVTNAE